MADRSDGHRLGWLGTGRMGISLIHRLLGAGCDVTVYNRTKAKAEPLAAAGAKVVDYRRRPWLGGHRLRDRRHLAGPRSTR